MPEWIYKNTRKITAVTCSCSDEYAPVEPWQRPLLTDRLGLRRDAYMSRVKGAYVDREYMHPADVTAVLAERRRDWLYPLTQRMEDTPRGDAWRWGSEPSFGGQGNQRVGPGWSSDAPRFDNSIELVIDGRRCLEIDGAWRDAETGASCPLAQER